MAQPEDQDVHTATLVSFLRLRADNRWVNGVTDQVLFKEAADWIENGGPPAAGAAEAYTPGEPTAEPSTPPVGEPQG